MLMLMNSIYDIFFLRYLVFAYLFVVTLQFKEVLIILSFFFFLIIRHLLLEISCLVYLMKNDQKCSKSICMLKNDFFI